MSKEELLETINRFATTYSTNSSSNKPITEAQFSAFKSSLIKVLREIVDSL